jgi:hypothetical protein
LPLVAKDIGKASDHISASELRRYVEKIDPATLAPAEIRAAQGSAGMKEIFDMLKEQVLG